MRAPLHTAGVGRATRAIRAAALFHPAVSPRYLAYFRGPDVELVAAECIDNETNLAAALVFGGDGTIHRHLRPLIEGKIPLLAVPVGSGNDFAAALEIHSVNDALSAWQKFCSGAQNVKSIDVGTIRSVESEAGATQPGTQSPKLETYFCNIAGLGLDSEANRLANAMPRWLRSRGGYILGALQAILSFTPAAVTISVEGEAAAKISEPAMLVAVANTASYGSGMRMAPRAHVADGLLDICFVRRTGRVRLLRSFPRVFRGQHLAMPEVEYFQSSAVRITSERPLDLYADGELVCQTPLEISVLPNALRVIVPAV